MVEQEIAEINADGGTLMPNYDFMEDLDMFTKAKSKIDKNVENADDLYQYEQFISELLNVDFEACSGRLELIDN